MADKGKQTNEINENDSQFSRYMEIAQESSDPWLRWELERLQRTNQDFDDWQLQNASRLDRWWEQEGKRFQSRIDKINLETWDENASHGLRQHFELKISARKKLENDARITTTLQALADDGMSIDELDCLWFAATELATMDVKEIYETTKRGQARIDDALKAGAAFLSTIEKLGGAAYEDALDVWSLQKEWIKKRIREGDEDDFVEGWEEGARDYMEHSHSGRYSPDFIQLIEVALVKLEEEKIPSGVSGAVTARRQWNRKTAIIRAFWRLLHDPIHCPDRTIAMTLDGKKYIYREFKLTTNMKEAIATILDVVFSDGEKLFFLPQDIKNALRNSISYSQKP